MTWVVPDGDTHFKHFLNKGNYQENVYNLLLRHTPTRELAIDIGAHVGFFTARFARDFRRVVAFEPILENFLCLSKNIGPKYPTALLINAAVGSGHDRRLYLHKDVNSGSWSADIPTPLEEHVCRTVSLLPLGRWWRSMMDINEPISAIKLDIQGMEREALETAEALLVTHKPTVCVEGPPKTKGDAQEYLEALGAKEVGRTRRDVIMKWSD